MRAERLTSYVGKVVGIDLVTGITVTTLLKEIKEDTNEIVCGDLLVFAANPEPRNPTQPPHPVSNPIELRVRNVRYGYPLFTNMKKENAFSLEYVVMVHEPTSEMVQVYQRDTSGIMPANAGVLDTLKDIDLSNIGGKLSK